MVDHLNEETRVPNAPGKETPDVKKTDPGKADALTNDDPDALPATFKVVEVRDGLAILDLGDGRMFPAEVGKVEDVKKHATVTIKNESINKDGVPVGATVFKVK